MCRELIAGSLRSDWSHRREPCRVDLPAKERRRQEAAEQRGRWQTAAMAQLQIGDGPAGVGGTDVALGELLQRNRT